jgi:DNA (cytosine-5)-methyltransferase 1
MSLGFEQAGFDVAAAVEIDPIHAAVHQFNFPKSTPIVRSVLDLSAGEIRRKARLDRKAIDVVFGGAPCQGFSLIGQRALDDPRNRLVKEFVRLVAELDAKYFVFENVKGLTLGPHRRFLDELIEAFSDVGYQVLPWRVLNAASYGVPQNRERLILLGARNGLALPQYPQETTSVESKDLLPRTPTCRDALGDLPEAEGFEELVEGDTVATTGWGTPSPYARALRGRIRGDLSYPRVWKRTLLTSSMRTDHTPISRRRFAATLPGEVEPISRFFRLRADGLANTLRAGTDSARGAFTSPRPIHYAEDRCVTVREMARLHGFPDWFRFHKTKWHGARQVGNAVPPPLARAVAAEVARALRAKPVRPTTPVRLGDELLLELDMQQAASHFAVPVVIGRRDRKSGMKKRRQEDIEAELLEAAQA